MTKYKFLFFITICITFSACKKINYKTTSVKGVFWDYCGERPMPGLKVALLEGTYKGSGYSIRTIKELTTNTDGTFDFGEFDADKREQKHFYKVVYIASDSDYTSRGLGESQGVKNISEWKIIPNTLNNDTLRICGELNFRLQVNPNPPYNATDSLEITFKGKYNNNFGGEVILKYIQPDGFVNSYSQVMAGYYDVLIKKVKNNTKSISTSKLYLGWKEHQIYLINF
ncbi:MAG: hypothetical protein V4667_13580 [Bacteroidota bacterium]